MNVLCNVSQTPPDNTSKHLVLFTIQIERHVSCVDPEFLPVGKYSGMRGGSTRSILVILLYIRIKEGRSGPDTEKQR